MKAVTKTRGSEKIHMAAHVDGVYAMYSSLTGSESEIAPTATEAIELIIARDVWIGPKSLESGSKQGTLNFLRAAAKAYDAQSAAAIAR